MCGNEAVVVGNNLKVSWYDFSLARTTALLDSGRSINSESAEEGISKRLKGEGIGRAVRLVCFLRILRAASEFAN